MSEWTVPRPELPSGPMTGTDDGPILTAYLAYQRATLQHICAGLTAEQLAARALAPSNLSLLGLLRHLAKVERIWFRQRIAGEDVPPLYDPALGKDADFDLIDAHDAAAALEQWQAECAAAVRAAAGVPFEYEIDWRGEAMSVRMVYVHVIAEYARHNGHADLLREHLDGVTGR